MPKQALRFPDGSMEWGEYEDAEPGPDQILIRSEFSAAKHGTELAGTYRGRWDNDMEIWIPQPRPEPKPGQKPRGGGVGNMTVGVVEKTGSEVTSPTVGDRVVTHGGFRQTHVRPAGRVRKMPEGLTWKSAVCEDPADFAMAAVRDGHVRVGDRVAVFGMGAIGLMAVQIAKVSGASLVIAVEPLPNRRAIAERVGADVVFDPAACDVALEIKRLTGKGVDVAIEYSAHWKAFQECLRCVAYGGNVVAGGFPAPYPAGLDLGGEAHKNIPNIIFSRSCSQPDREYPRWDHQRVVDACWRLLVEGRISGEEVVAPVVDFEDILSEYPKIATEPDKYVKIGCKY